ncbi:MAG: hypothetical protein RMI30_07215 [Thermodesulfovibrio sp.]|nr:hypothetical protein [Thermodesulfovibrio sp.]MDW7999213.1 hypothetical protein [Thermodesulfovibrio sp.]
MPKVIENKISKLIYELKEIRKQLIIQKISKSRISEKKIMK